MKYYFIEDICSQWNNLFVVKAENKKEALDIVWKRMGYDKQEPESVSGYKPHYKKDFKVRELTQLFNTADAINTDNCALLN